MPSPRRPWLVSLPLAWPARSTGVWQRRQPEHVIHPAPAASAPESRQYLTAVESCAMGTGARSRSTRVVKAGRRQRGGRSLSSIGFERSRSNFLPLTRQPGKRHAARCRQVSEAARAAVAQSTLSRLRSNRHPTLRQSCRHRRAACLQTAGQQPAPNLNLHPNLTAALASNQSYRCRIMANAAVIPGGTQQYGGRGRRCGGQSVSRSGGWLVGRSGRIGADDYLLIPLLS